jgi:hypothetical protein
VLRPLCCILVLCGLVRLVARRNIDANNLGDVAYSVALEFLNQALIDFTDQAGPW